MHLAMIISLACWLAGLACYAWKCGHQKTAAVLALVAILLGMRAARILNSNPPTE